MSYYKQTLAAFALAAATIAGPVSTVQATPLVVGGGWTVLLEDMVAPAFFTGVGNKAGPDSPGPWTFTCPPPHCKFLITDLFVISDQFRVYDFGALIATTPAMPDWDALGLPSSNSPPFTADPDDAWATAEYSKLVIVLAAGAHSITIEDIHIPLCTTATCIDGSVAFRVVVPEPGTLALLGIALAGLGFARRKIS